MAAARYGPVCRALGEALKAVDRRPEDAAAVALARAYARQIDTDPGMLAKVGPPLLAVLVELGMTPKARAGVMKGGGSSDSNRRSALDELRAKRDRRANGTTTVDAPPS